MIEYLRRLFEHLAWADERVVEVVDRTEDPQALRLLSHLLAAEVVWYARIETGQSEHLNIWPTLTGEQCRDLSRENVRAYRKIVDELTPEALEREIVYRNSKGTEYRTALADILLHVALHGTYHRGQIALRLRDADHEPVNTDYITFVREKTGQ